MRGRISRRLAYSAIVGSIATTFGFKGGIAEAAIDAHWATAASGNWTNASLWSTNPFYPNQGNPSGSAYNAFIDASGGPYSVTLASSITLAGLTFNAAKATISGQSSLEVDGTMLLQAGTFNMTGTLSNTNIIGSATSFLTLMGSMNHVAIGGDGTNPSLVASGDSSAPSGISFAGGLMQIDSARFSPYGPFALGGPITGSGTLSLNPISGQKITLAASSGGTLSIASGINIITKVSPPGSNMGSSAIGTATNNISNAGVISAQSSRQALYINGANILNTGTIQAINGGYLTVTGDLTNSGHLIENNSSLTLAIANFSPSILPTIERTGGNVNIATTFVNTASTLALTSATGSLGLINGGRINGGLVTTSGGSKLNIAASYNYQFHPGTILDGVSIAGDMVIQEQGSVSVRNNLTLQNGTITFGTSNLPLSGVGGDGTWMDFFGNNTFGGTGTVLLKATAAYDQISTESASSLTIGPGITVRTDTGGGTINGVNIVNQGTISAQTNNVFLNVSSTPMINQGTMSATNGSRLAVTNLSNTALLTADASTISFDGTISNAGTISATNSTVLINGTFSNSGNMTLTNSTVNWHVYSPALTAANITHSGQTIFSAAVSNLAAPLDLAHTPFGPADLGYGANLSNLTVVSDVSVNVLSNSFVIINANVSANVIMQPSSTFQGAITLQNGSIVLSAFTQLYTTHLAGTGTYTLNGIGSSAQIGSSFSLYNPPVPLTIDPQIIVCTGTGSGLVTNTSYGVINQGILSAAANGQFLFVSGATDNQGLIEAINGGKLWLQYALTNEGTLHAGASSLLSLANITNSSTAQTKIDIGSTAAVGKISSTGSVVLNGALLVAFSNSYVPQSGDSFAFITTTGSITGQFSSVTTAGTLPARLAMNLNYGSKAVTATLALVGDADFDAFITMNDYSLLEAGFFFGNFNAVTNPASWSHGDFNNDGVVNYEDFALIDAAFQSQSGALANDMIALHSSEFGNSYTQALTALETPVPEPASLALLTLGGIGLLRGRLARRR